MSPSPLRRFWKTVTVQASAGGFVVALDGKAIRAPSKRPLLVESLALAEAMAEEWRAITDSFTPSALPLTQLANTAFDRVTPERAAMTATLLEYVDGDVLCYRATDPPGLRDRQQTTWDPWLHWIAGRTGAVWQTTDSLMPLVQPAAVHTALANDLATLSTAAFTAFQASAPLIGSLVVGLALVAGHVTAEQAFAIGHVDELWQSEHWGDDYEALDRRAAVLADLRHAHRYLVLQPPISSLGSGVPIPA